VRLCCSLLHYLLFIIIIVIFVIISSYKVFVSFYLNLSFPCSHCLDMNSQVEGSMLEV